MIGHLFFLGAILLWPAVQAEEARLSTEAKLSEAPAPAQRTRKSHKKNPYNPRVFMQKKNAGRTTIGGVAAAKVVAARDGAVSTTVMQSSSTSKVNETFECQPVEQRAPCSNGAKNCARPPVGQIKSGVDGTTAETGAAEPGGQDISKALTAFVKNNCGLAKNTEKKVDVEVGVTVSKLDEPKTVQEPVPDIRKQVGGSVGVRTKF